MSRLPQPPSPSHTVGGITMLAMEAVAAILTHLKFKF